MHSEHVAKSAYFLLAAAVLLKVAGILSPGPASVVMAVGYFVLGWNCRRRRPRALSSTTSND